MSLLCLQALAVCTFCHICTFAMAFRAASRAQQRRAAMHRSVAARAARAPRRRRAAQPPRGGAWGIRGVAIRCAARRRGGRGALRLQESPPRRAEQQDAFFQGATHYRCDLRSLCRCGASHKAYKKCCTGWWVQWLWSFLPR
jgi:hypothetical protein